MSTAAEKRMKSYGYGSYVEITWIHREQLFAATLRNSSHHSKNKEYQAKSPDLQEALSKLVDAVEMGEEAL